MKVGTNVKILSIHSFDAYAGQKDVLLNMIGEVVEHLEVRNREGKIYHNCEIKFKDGMKFFHAVEIEEVK